MAVKSSHDSLIRDVICVEDVHRFTDFMRKRMGGFVLQHPTHMVSHSLFKVMEL